MHVRFMRVATLVRTPLPVKDSGTNAPIEYDVFNAIISISRCDTKLICKITHDVWLWLSV
jgi:hypothetical protein